MLKTTAKGFNIDEVAFAKLNFCTDMGPNLINAFKNYNRYDCTAHALNLVLKTAFTQAKHPELHKIHDLLCNSKSVIEHVKRTKHTANLTHRLVQSVDTRFNYNFYMLESIEKNYEALDNMLKISSELANPETNENSDSDDFTDAVMNNFYINRQLLHELLIVLGEFETAIKSMEFDTQPIPFIR